MQDFALKVAAWRNDDRTLSQNAVETDALRAGFSGATIALVGNARALSQHSFGEDIDAADVVIRINRAPIPSSASHGKRTDILSLATSLDKAAFAALSPTYLMWMSHKRKRIQPWMVRLPGFSLFPREWYLRVKDKLGKQPTTGVLMIDWLASSDAKSIDLYGFDFFASRSLSGSRSSEQVPHDFNAERLFVSTLIENDPRFTLHAMK